MSNNQPAHRTIIGHHPRDAEAARQEHIWQTRDPHSCSGCRSRRGNRLPLKLGEKLIRREVSILERLESGLSNKEIAETNFVSEGTLEWHPHNVYSKRDVKNRSGAMARARTLGIV
jgi:ATP/maltotriose-dependent transcriptional regulator MalT